MGEPSAPQGPWWIQAIVQGGALVILAMVLYLDSQRDMRAAERLLDHNQVIAQILEQQIAATNELTKAVKMLTGP